MREKIKGMRKKINGMKNEKKEMRKWRLSAEDIAGDRARDKADKLQKIKQEKVKKRK